MSAFKHILVATDFGEAANHAFDLAVDIATKFESKVTLLHAYTAPHQGYGLGEGLLWSADDLMRIAQTELDLALRRARQRYPTTEAKLVWGEPWQETIETAKTVGADLIVMGTHGRRGLSRVLLGSVAEKVVRTSPIPVLTVSSKEDQKAKRTALTPEAAVADHQEPRLTPR
jgi:nucleotide-binding universal stress UspA family protein